MTSANALIIPPLGTYVPRGYIVFDWKLKMSVASETPKSHICYAHCSSVLGLIFLKLGVPNTLPMAYIWEIFQVCTFSQFLPGGVPQPKVCSPDSEKKVP